MTAPEHQARQSIDQPLADGVDGLILVATGAGGHAGRLSPFAYVPEVRQFYDGCVILAGGVASGGAILAAQALGAGLAYIGTRFIASEEANAPADYEQMIIDSRAEDIVYTNLFTGVHGNYLKGSIVNAGLDPDNLPESSKSKMDLGRGARRRRPGGISGGRGGGGAAAAPAAGQVVARLCAEYEGSLERFVELQISLNPIRTSREGPVVEGRIATGVLGAASRHHDHHPLSSSRRRTR